ncbi:MAG TPA: hypothetical protein VF548_08620 [Allosphingosinicella sp.]
MNAGRRLILPTLVATPAAMWTFGLYLIGWPGFTRFTFEREAVLVWAGLVAAALLLFGWPVGALLARLRTPAPVRLTLLIAAGVAGGGLVGALLGGPPGSILAMLPGAVTAAIWAGFNADLLAGRAIREAA